MASSVSIQGRNSINTVKIRGSRGTKRLTTASQLLTALPPRCLWREYRGVTFRAATVEKDPDPGKVDHSREVLNLASVRTWVPKSKKNNI